MTIPDKTAVDLAFILRDTHGDIEAAQRRIDSAIRQAHDDAIEKSAQAADKLFNGFHSPHEYSDDVAEEIRKLKHQTKGGA